MTEEISFSRSKFLQLSFKLVLGLAGILGLGGLVRYFSHQPAGQTPTIYDLGLAADFPASGELVRLDIPAIIYKTKDGFQAYSLVCTHLGCTVEEDGENFRCPCHGSQFDHDGRVLKGPATEELPTLSVTVSENGSLILNTGGGGK
jgi:cytochrome b6-f complex iron-sulfur subunit